MNRMHNAPWPLQIHFLAWITMTRSATAGFAYFAIVFGIGFVLGTVRVLVAVPRFGALVSELIELPIILTAAWIVCDRLSARLHVARRSRPRLTMGAVAFALLMIAELALSVSLFGNSVSEHFARYGSLPGALGLAGQILFAAFPLLQLAFRGGTQR
jgi:heme/copper-type cytochrome/quinol oxidase subunit 4